MRIRTLLTLGGTLAAGIVLLGGPRLALAAGEEFDVPAVEDVSVMRWDAEANYGDDPWLEIKNAAAGPTRDFDRKAYIRFDLTGIDRTSISRAAVVLQIIGGEGDPVQGPQQFAVYALPADASEAWAEDAATWMDAPLNDPGSGAGVLPPAERVATFVVDGTGVPGDVVRGESEELATYLREVPTLTPTLVVVRESEDAVWTGWWHAFASTETKGALPPTLRLSIAEVIDPGCPGDFDNDGSIDFDDVIRLLSSWGPCAGCPEDLDGDGFVAFADLLAMLSGWGSCA